MYWLVANRQHVFVVASSLFAPLLAGGCARPAGQLFEPAARGPVWPRSPEQARIRYVGMLRGSDDLRAAQSGREAFGAAVRGPRQPIQFSAPHSVARLGPLLAVADVGLAGVHLVNLPARTHVLVTGWREGEAAEAFVAPIGVCLAGDRVFVADAQRHEIIELSSAGAFRGRFGGSQLSRPVGMVHVRTQGRIYVVDGGAGCVVAFDLDGNEITRFNGQDAQTDALSFPTHIAWDGGTRLAVADSANFRVRLFGLDGSGLVTIGKKGDAAGDFALPKGVAFDAQGHLYVVDAQFENVQIFDGQGRLLLAFGREGGAAGEFALPAGLAIDEHDRIWVADSANHRIQVFDFLGGAP